MGLLLSTTGTAQPPFPGNSASPTPVLYLAQLGDDDLEDVEDDLEDEIEDLDDDIEDDIEAELEDEVEEQVEDELNDAAEEAVEDSLEDEAEDLAEELAEEAAENAVEDNLDDEAEDLAEDLAEDAAEDRLDEDDFDELDDDDLTEELEELDEDLEPADDSLDDDRLSDALEERLLDAVEDDLDSLVELNTGEVIVRNDMLVLADEALLDQLNRHSALRLRERRPLPALGTNLGNFTVRSGVSLEALRAELREAYPGLSVDFNHGYELNQGARASTNGPLSLSALYAPATPAHAQGGIGMLDGPVNADHPAFSGARLTQKAFVLNPSERDRAHGTAIASLLVGRTPQWQGLVPGAELYAASVFSEQARYGSIATTQSLITALDWLVSQSVDIINISLAGPANQTLETALKRVRDRGIVPVAAAGNAGPLADPQYPAAYPTVVAVTAIDRQRALYAYAVRGDHLDFSAYGVGLSAAAGEQGFEAVTGTSFAAPAVTALLVRYLAEGYSPEAALQALEADTLDLGEPGKDPMFGHGLAGQSQLSE
ncbi:S8 family serine peptidase [Marinimicrobium agarilyticum]|uniref:S8 family serine peptidase n=1 Tax=Marinimicrobium agarilyticum TaxID=306546 RepID=UPI0003F9A7ED|nr:S8 family serine peptidase [Marinimicrobium agarilyticum]